MGLCVSSAFLLALMLISSPCFAVKSFDHFSLILTWPGAYCEHTDGGCCLPKTGEPAGNFLIRDLRTYNSEGDSITECQNINFDYNQISGLSHDLETYWANIKCPSNNGRSNWKSKWKRYGVCSGLSETNYFKTGLDHLQKADIAFHLVKKDINPDYNLYKLADIKSAIAEGIGAEPLIRCSKGPFNKFQLFEVHICIDRNGSTIIECPTKPKFTCTDEILFYPYRSWMLKDTTKVFETNSNIRLPIDVENESYKSIEMSPRAYF
ncbi:hypothetical protein IEQ34_000397 [Dendrobium chrysotoxum]|uniref:Uncharacterized protein n=1 Tax=Dendrobium chrysotoxum TaxID=161865 RepID=A0AAV7HSB0_DENCH|nr:hypothetical protein IEQ34_000397 [Dendrobium chrysotoxum]